MLVQLTRKLANIVNGVDLSTRSVGDVFELPHGEAQFLLREGWATLVDRRGAPDRRRKTSELKQAIDPDSNFSVQEHRLNRRAKDSRD